MSQSMTKLTKWPVHPAKTQISLSSGGEQRLWSPGWSESLLDIWAILLDFSWGSSVMDAHSWKYGVKKLPYTFFTEAYDCGWKTNRKMFVPNITSFCWQRLLVLFLCPEFLEQSTTTNINKRHPSHTENGLSRSLQNSTSRLQILKQKMYV